MNENTKTAIFINKKGNGDAVPKKVVPRNQKTLMTNFPSDSDTEPKFRLYLTMFVKSSAKKEELTKEVISVKNPKRVIILGNKSL